MDLRNRLPTLEEKKKFGEALRLLIKEYESYIDLKLLGFSFDWCALTGQIFILVTANAVVSSIWHRNEA